MGEEDIEPWKAFEQDVARLYESLGFYVTKNHSIAGQQVDVVAEQSIAGVGYVRLLIECKFRAIGKVSNQEVYDFITMFGTVKQAGGFSNGVLVTNADFSAAARAAAHHARDIQLLHLRDLENTLFNVADACGAYVQEYSDDPMYTLFVPLRGRGRLPIEHLGNEEVADMEERLLEWLVQGKGGFLSILADFGSGKSTLMRRLKFRLAQRYLAARETPLAVLFLLKEMHRFDELDDFISHSLVREFRRNIPLSVFWRHVQAGRFVFLLDGFDEVFARADKLQRTHAFLELSHLFTSGCASIMTCRPSFFLSNAEYNELFDLLKGGGYSASGNAAEGVLAPRTKARSQQLTSDLYKRFVKNDRRRRLSPDLTSTMHILSFDESQIDAFLQRCDAQFREHIGADWVAVKEFLLHVYDVRDLMRRPILLNMIVETILSGYVDIKARDIELGASSLYEAYTQVQFRLESEDKLRDLLTPAERANVTEMIAYRMFTSGQLELQIDDVLTTARDLTVLLPSAASKLQGVSAEVIATDLQLCSFLSRDQARFRFVHKSFMEFFVARYLQRRLEAKPIDELLQKDLPGEVLYFLGGFGATDRLTLSRLGQLSETADPKTETGRCLKRNMVSAMLLAGPELGPVSIASCEITHRQFGNNTLSNSRVRTVEFVDTTWQTLTLHKSKVEDVKLRRCSIGQFTISNGSTDLYLEDADIGHLAITEGQATLKGTGTHIQNTTFGSCKVRLAGGVTLFTGEADDAMFVVGDGGIEAVLENFKFKHCTVGSPANRSVLTAPDAVTSMLFGLEGVWMEDCVLAWPCVHESDFWFAYERQRLLRCSGPVLIRRAISQKAHGVAEHRSLKAGEHSWVEDLCLIATDLPVTDTKSAESTSVSAHVLARRKNAIERELRQRLGAVRLGRIDLLDRHAI